MEEKKLLGEFAAKIAKSKLIYTSTKDYVEKLKREATKLEREYEQLVEERKAAETLENNLKINFRVLQKQNDEETNKYSQEVARLSDLKDQKNKLKRDKNSADHDLLKNTLYLEELVKQR